MSKILKSKLGRFMQLQPRQIMLDKKSDEQVEIRKEFQDIWMKMQRNRYKLEYTVDLEGAKAYGDNELSDEIKTHLADYLNKNNKGFWFLDHKNYPTLEPDGSGSSRQNYDIMIWRFILMFELEEDLDRFTTEQVLITKLTF